MQRTVCSDIKDFKTQCVGHAITAIFRIPTTAHESKLPS